jgi:hypothetical protein
VRRGWSGFLTLMCAPAMVVYADVIDVSRQWQEHASTAPIVISTASTQLSVEESTPDAEPHCGCESLTVQEKLFEASVAFTGVVESVQPPKKGRQKMVFDVDEIFKGSPKPDAEIVAEVTTTPCDLTFQEGKKYLIYARWEWGTYVTARCMGTKEIAIARSDASALGPSESMKEKLYLQLRNACMGRMDTPCCLSSLKAMRQDYSIPEPEGGCPAGTKPDRLLCGGSYAWCIPVTQKDHRQSTEETK